MSSRDVSSLTVTELKDLLRAQGLPTAGTKAELISRLQNSDPSGQWASEVREDEVTSDERISRENDDVHQTRRELDLLQREKVLMERELEVARRELELLRSMHHASVSERGSPATQDGQSPMNVKTVAELLSYFNGKTEDFPTWSKQIQVLQAKYRLDDDEAKVLMGMRLRGRAQEWMHSRSEFIEMSIDNLLKEFEGMFHHRPSKIITQKQFQDRIWKRDEAFEEYFYDKVIKANRIPIDDDIELVDYLVEGIPDTTLRNQARMHCFNSPESLLRAFERLRLP